MNTTNEQLPVDPTAKNFLPATMSDNNPIHRLSDPSIVQVKKTKPLAKRRS